MLLDNFLQSIDPTFALGHTSSRHLDCAGLIILWLRSCGYKCLWEPEIVRQLTTLENVEAQLRRVGFKPASVGGDAPLVVSWQPNRDSGHLGLYQPLREVTYHMTPWGLREERGLTGRYWVYQGE